jgi:hypothetical protein
VAELRVAIMDQKPDRLVIAELHDEVPCLLVTQRPSGFEMQATYSIRRVASEMKNNT